MESEVCVVSSVEEWEGFVAFFCGHQTTVLCRRSCSTRSNSHRFAAESVPVVNDDAGCRRSVSSNDPFSWSATCCVFLPRIGMASPLRVAGGGVSRGILFLLFFMSKPVLV